MTDYSQHPIRQDGERFVGPDVELKNQKWFIRQDPHTRRAYLGQMSAAITQDDNVSLKKKSQLWADLRRLDQLDRELRAVER